MKWFCHKVELFKCWRDWAFTTKFQTDVRLILFLLES